MFIVR
jgi:RNA recognition motif-containing protein